MAIIDELLSKFADMGLVQDDICCMNCIECSTCSHPLRKFDYCQYCPQFRPDPNRITKTTD